MCSSDLGDIVELTPELKELFNNWVALAPEQKQAALLMVKAMNVPRAK